MIYSHFVFGMLSDQVLTYVRNQYKNSYLTILLLITSELFVCILLWTFKNEARAITIMTYSLFICDIRQHLVFATEDI